MNVWFREFPTASAAFNTGYRALRLYVSSRSWRTWAAAGSHYLKKIRGIPAPTFVTVAVTYECQCRCDHCYSDSPVRPDEAEMTTAELKTVLRQVRALGSQAVHERFRGTPHLYEHVLRAANTLREFGLPCRIMTVALKHEVPEGLARTIALGRSLGARYMYIILPIAVGGWDGAYDQVLNFKEREQIRALQDLTVAHVELPTEGTNCCVFRKSILYVSANGNVTPCAFVPYVLGNVRKQPLGQIWRRHTGRLSQECRGDCPMNIPAKREALQRHVASVARESSQISR